jgi:hypothetical protein
MCYKRDLPPKPLLKSPVQLKETERNKSMVITKAHYVYHEMPVSRVEAASLK